MFPFKLAKLEHGEFKMPAPSGASLGRLLLLLLQRRSPNCRARVRPSDRHPRVTGSFALIRCLFQVPPLLRMRNSSMHGVERAPVYKTAIRPLCVKWSALLHSHMRRLYLAVDVRRMSWKKHLILNGRATQLIALWSRSPRCENLDGATNARFTLAWFPFWPQGGATRASILIYSFAETKILCPIRRQHQARRDEVESTCGRWQETLIINWLVSVGILSQFK